MWHINSLQLINLLIVSMSGHLAHVDTLKPNTETSMLNIIKLNIKQV